MKKKTFLIAALLIAAGVPASAATAFTLDFEDIPSAGTPAEGPNSALGSDILGYYNGDPVYHRAGAQDLGVTFNPGSLAITAKSAGGSGSFAKAYSGVSVAGRIEGDEMSFTLDQGLSLASLDFHYDGVPGSGPVLRLYSSGGAVQQYAQGLSLCTVPGSDGFCGWTGFGLPGTVLGNLASKGILIDKVAWTAEPNQFVVDYVHVVTAVPEPSAFAMAACGLSLVAFGVRRRAG